FDLFDNTDDFVNRWLIDQTARPIDEKTSVFMKFDVRRKFHHLLRDLTGCLIAPFPGPFSEPVQRNTQPFRGVFSFLEYSNTDWGLLRDYGMQLEIVANGGIGRENCRFHRWPISVRKHSI